MLNGLLPASPPAGRLEYAGSLLNITGGMALYCTIGLDGASEVWQAGLIIISVFFLLMLPLKAVSRLADLGRPPRQAWLVLAPGYNLYFVALLLCKPGKQFRTEPMKPLEVALCLIPSVFGAVLWGVAIFRLIRALAV